MFDIINLWDRDNAEKEKRCVTVGNVDFIGDRAVPKETDLTFEID